MLMGIDHSYEENLFASGGSVVQLWNYDRSAPLQTFEWGVDTVTKLKFNPSQINLLASVAVDRSVCLYDIRGNTPINKIYLKNKSAALCWNP
jgi:WD repeat and SOF domain-containing protein 1